MQGKSFNIPKELVWHSYQAVKKNRGAPGFDRVTITDFDLNRDKNLYKIWNRLCSGTYFPPPVLEKKIPKLDGGDRVLGIPTVSDRIAQGAVKAFLEKIVEPLFHENSYGYRPQRSAHQAIAITADRCRKQFWALEVDIKGFFDNVGHTLILKSLSHLHVPRWVTLYCDRWLKASIVNRKGNLTLRTKGTPQGGVISPLLANLFLHYAVDKWMTLNFPNNKFSRYADDLIFHFNSMKEAKNLRDCLTRRLKAVGLEVNESKTNYIYLGTYERNNVKTKFTFLGYDFEYRTMRNHNSGEIFRKIAPGASKKAMRKITKTIRGWRLHRSTTDTIQIFARNYNAKIRGWIQYYGKFWYRNFSYRIWSAVQSRLLKWIKAKYKVANRQADKMLKEIKRKNPEMFAHWYMLRKMNE